MKYRCTECGTPQWRGLIAERGVNIWTVVLLGPAVVLGWLAADSLVTYLALDKTVHGLFIGLIAGAIVFSLHSSLVSAPEYLMVTRRGCTACGARELEWVPAWYSSAASAIAAGDLYALRGKDGDYSIVKVLVVDDVAVHLRSYANRFPQCPANVNSSELSMGGLGDPGGFGIGHFPLSKSAFEHENRTLVGREPVAHDELDGYRIWAGIDSIDDASSEDPPD